MEPRVKNSKLILLVDPKRFCSGGWGVGFVQRISLDFMWAVLCNLLTLDNNPPPPLLLFRRLCPRSLFCFAWWMRLYL